MNYFSFAQSVDALLYRLRIIDNFQPPPPPHGPLDY